MNKLILTLLATAFVTVSCYANASDGSVTVKNGGIYTVGSKKK